MSRHQRVSAYLAAAVFLLTLAGNGIAETINDIQIRVPYDNDDQLRQLYRMGLDVIFRGDGQVDIVTNPEELEAIQKAGFRTEIVHESVSSFYRTRLAPKDMGGYMTLSEVEAAVDVIIADHSSIVTTRRVYGTTLEGRDWYAIKISDNPYVDEDEPEALFTGGIHAREVITPLIMLAFMDRLTDNYGTDPTITELVDEREVWIVPIVNPDGYYFNEVAYPGGGGVWRKNRRDNGDGTFGVDLNRNFDYMWGYDDVGSSPKGISEVYRGTEPFSEPEARAYRDLVESREIFVSMDYHAYFNAVMWPWAYISENTPDNDSFQRLATDATSLNHYELWTPTHPDLIGLSGLTIDWLYGERSIKGPIFAFLVEVGAQSDGFWPPVERIPQLVSENMMPMQYILDQADLGFLCPATPDFEVPAEAPGGDYTVSWTHVDRYNPAVDFELTELRDPNVVPDRCDVFQDWETDGFRTSTRRYQSSPSSFWSGPSPQGQAVTLKTIYYLEVSDGDTLHYNIWHQLDPYKQFLYTEISTDGINFESIPGNLTSDNDPYGNNDGNAITGSSGDWLDAEFDLSAFAGQSILFRLRCVMPYGTDRVQGVYIDDFSHHLRFDRSSTVIVDAPTTEFSFVDKPLGEYFYSLRARDAESQYSFRTPCASTRVLSDQAGCCDDRVGDADGVGGDVPTIGDVSAMIDALFIHFDWNVIPCLAEADVDQSGGPEPLVSDITIGDVAYLIDYLLITGSSLGLPSCP